MISTVSSHADGSFSFDGIPPGRYAAKILTGDKFFPAEFVQVDAGQIANVVATAATSELFGTIRDSSGNPVPNAVLKIVVDDNVIGEPTYFTFQTNADGSYEVDAIPAGNVRLIVSVNSEDGLQKSVEANVEAGSNSIDVQLDDLVAVSGRFLNSSGGSFDSGTVIASNMSFADAQAIGVPVDESGNWQFDGLSAGTYRFYAFTQADGVYAFVEVDVSASAQFDIQTNETTGSVSGNVTDSTSSLPLTEAEIYVLDDQGIVIAASSTDSNGYYVVNGVYEGNYSIRVTTDLGEIDSSVFSVSSGEISSQDFQIVPVAVGQPEVEIAAQLRAIQDACAGYTSAVAPACRDLKRAEEQFRLIPPLEPLPEAEGILADSLACLDNGLFAEYQRLSAELDRLGDMRSQLGEELSELQRSEQSLRANMQQALMDAYTGLINANSLWVRITSALNPLNWGASFVCGTIGKIPGEKLIGQLLGGVIEGACKEVLKLVDHAERHLRNAEAAIGKYANLVNQYQKGRFKYNAKARAYQTDVRQFNEDAREYNRQHALAENDCNFLGDRYFTVQKEGDGNPYPATASEMIFPDGVPDGVVEVYLDRSDDGSGISVSPNSINIGDGDCGHFSGRIVVVLQGLANGELVTETHIIEVHVNRLPSDREINIPCDADAPDDPCFPNIVRSNDCGSMDPNDIVGPNGVGSENWVRGDAPLNYMIRFENDADEADAPAAVVRIEQQLDTDLDFSSFELGVFGFGNFLFDEAIGLPSYQTRIDLRTEFGIYLDVSAGIDVETGLASWELKSIDPATGAIPFSPLVGFLPPNNDGVEGQGFVTYKLSAKADASTGDVVDSEATIFFDQNEPIDTPSIFNTFDVGAPASSVEPLSVQSFPGFQVTWSGTDDGSGIRTYDVFVATDEGEYVPWLMGTTRTEAFFDFAIPGHTYDFFSVATDRVGHVEEVPATADTSTLVVEPPSTEVVSVDIVSTSGTTFTVEFADDMTIPDMISDGSIVDAVTLLSYASGPIELSSWSFAYDEMSFTLTISSASGLPSGFYDLVLDGGLFQSTSGALLEGGSEGIAFGVPTYEQEMVLQSGGSDIVVEGCSVPLVADWNNDGLHDLVVGERVDDEGRLRVYLNSGTNESPVYSGFTYAQTLTGDLVVNTSASGCIGMFPRLFDWNGDDELDLVVGTSDGRAQVWTNVNTQAEPVFDLPEFIQVGVAGAKADLLVFAPTSLDVIDWNNDGRHDLVVGDADGRLLLYINESSTSNADFISGVPIFDGNGPLIVTNSGASVALADVNNDSRKDLVIGLSDGRMLAYPNIGWDSEPAFDGHFEVRYQDGSGVLSVGSEARPFVTDVNEDGFLDLVVGAADGRVRLFEATSDLVFPTVDAFAGRPFNFTFEVTSGTTNQNVESISVGSSEWTGTFPFLNGFELPTLGTALLPWDGLNQITMVYSGPVDPMTLSISVLGVNVADYAVGSPVYDPGSFTVMWQLQTSVDADRIQVRVGGGGTIAEQFQFNVLSGDVNQNGTVAVSDIGPLRDALGSSAGDPTYSALADLNADGSVSVEDIAVLRANLGLTLPANLFSLVADKFDFDNDGIVSPLDALMLVNALNLREQRFHSQRNDFVWDERYDLNGDDELTEMDAAIAIDRISHKTTRTSRSPALARTEYDFDDDSQDEKIETHIDEIFKMWT